MIGKKAEIGIQLIDKRKWQWVISGLVTLLMFSVTYLTTDVLFSTNDDIRIMYALAGYNTGNPYPYHPFINYFLGRMISWEYQLFPELPWYAIFHIVCLFTGTAVIGKCLLKLAAKHKYPAYIPIVLHVILFYTIIIFPVVSMQFSTTPAVLGIASAALVFTLDIDHERKKYIYADLVISILFLTICYMTRSFTWYCVMCFYGLSVFYQLLQFLPGKVKDQKKWIFILCSNVLSILILVFILRYVSLSLKDLAEINDDFEKYNEYRTKFQDYQMREDYYNAPEFYNKLGWSENTYRAALGLLFLDENMNTENMQKITEEYETNSPVRGIKETYWTAKSVFEGNRVAKTGIAVILVLFFCGIFLYRGRKSCWRENICLILSFLGYLLMYVYLSYKGRLPIRTFMVITIAESVMETLFLLSAIKNIRVKNYKIYSCLGMPIFVALIMYNIRAIYFTDECSKTQTETVATKEGVEQFESYAISHPNDVFIYDFTIATIQRNPFVVFKDMKPTNCIVSGGSYTFSTIYYKQLECNNLSSLYWEDLLIENIYYATADVAYVDLVRDNISQKIQRDVWYENIVSFDTSEIKIYKFNANN